MQPEQYHKDSADDVHCRLMRADELSYNGKHKIMVALATIPGLFFRIYYKLFRGI